MYMVHSFFFVRIYFIRISWLKFSKFQEYFKNKPKAADDSKKEAIVLCIENRQIPVDNYTMFLIELIDKYSC